MSTNFNSPPPIISIDSETGFILDVPTEEIPYMPDHVGPLEPVDTREIKFYWCERCNRRRCERYEHKNPCKSCGYPGLIDKKER